MRYIMIDTNIFIDMIVDRKHNVNSKLMESFIKLLDFNEIRLVIPEIVKYETNKHLEEQLSEVGKKIRCAINAIDEMYGINGYTIDGLEISNYKKVSKKELQELRNKYNANKESYLSEIQKIVTKIFEHKNCIIIPDTEKLRSLCLKRRIYKRAPFHREKKESYADGLIIESLLNIKDNITINDDDNIIFVTGNTDDFSDNTNKEKLHRDIVEDLKNNTLLDKVQYLLRFNELIGKELKNEVERANLKEDFERQLQEEAEIERAMIKAEIDDKERESVGLSSLSRFETKFRDSFIESDFAENAIGLLERLNSCYLIFNEILDFYSEDLKLHVSNIDVNKTIDLIEQWNDIYDEIDSIEVTKDVNGIRNILEWIDGKIEESDYSNVAVELPDTLNYGDSIQFYTKDREKYELTMDELCLTCSNGDVDWLNIELTNESDIKITGVIEIIYGFVEFDDDGGVGNACDQEISYDTDEIIEFIESILDDFEKFVCEEQVKVEALKNAFGI